MSKNTQNIVNPKKGKPAILIGWFLSFVGIIMVPGGDEGFYVIIVGIGLIIYGKIVHWWHWQ